MIKKIILKNLSDTEKLAKRIANELKKYNEIFLLLSGNLASGKTTLAKYIISYLGIKDETNSPSFVIMNQYNLKNKQVVNHVDFYRLNDTENIDLYFEQFENSINIIEWPNIILNYIKDRKIININLKISKNDFRVCKISTNYKLIYKNKKE